MVSRLMSFSRKNCVRPVALYSTPTLAAIFGSPKMLCSLITS